MSPVLEKYQSLKEVSLKIHSENTKQFESLQRDSPLNEIVNEITLNIKNLEDSRDMKEDETDDQRPAVHSFHETIFSHSYTYLDSQAHFAVETLGAKKRGRRVLYRDIQPLFQAQNMHGSLGDETITLPFDPSVPLTDSEHSSSISSIDKASSSGYQSTECCSGKDSDATTSDATTGNKTTGSATTGNTATANTTTSDATTGNTTTGNAITGNTTTSGMSSPKKGRSFSDHPGTKADSSTVTNNIESRVGEERKVLFRGIDKPGVLEETQLFKSSSPVKVFAILSESSDHESSPTIAREQFRDSESRSILKASARLEPDEIHLNSSPLPLDSDLDISDDFLSTSDSGSDFLKATFIDESKLEEDLAKITGNLDSLALSPELLTTARVRKQSGKMIVGDHPEILRPSTPPPVIFGNDGTEDFFRNSESSQFDCSPELKEFILGARGLLEVRESPLSDEISDYVPTPEPRSSESSLFQSSDIKSSSPDEDEGSDPQEQYHTPEAEPTRQVVPVSKSRESSVIDFDELFNIGEEKQEFMEFAQQTATSEDTYHDKRAFRFKRTYFNPYTGIIKVIESPVRPSAPPWPGNDQNISGSQAVKFVDDKIPDLPSPINRKLSPSRANEKVENIERETCAFDTEVVSSNPKREDDGKDNADGNSEKKTRSTETPVTTAIVEVSQVESNSSLSEFERFLRLIFTPLNCNCWSTAETTPSPVDEDVPMIASDEQCTAKPSDDMELDLANGESGCHDNANVKSNIPETHRGIDRNLLPEISPNISLTEEVKNNANVVPDKKYNIPSEEYTETPNSFSSRSSIGYEEFTEKYRERMMKKFEGMLEAKDVEPTAENKIEKDIAFFIFLCKAEGDEANCNPDEADCNPEKYETDSMDKEGEIKATVLDGDANIKPSEGAIEKEEEVKMVAEDNYDSPSCTIGIFNFLPCVTQDESPSEPIERDPSVNRVLIDGVVQEQELEDELFEVECVDLDVSPTVTNVAKDKIIPSKNDSQDEANEESRHSERKKDQNILAVMFTSSTKSSESSSITSTTTSFSSSSGLAFLAYL